ncbi:hypothetical protein J2802_004940 [Paraburkholderia caribensis]|nr:hypothetical protein [Paraburkholderia caribensis]
MMERVRIRSLFGLLLTAAISSAPASGQTWHGSRLIRGFLAAQNQ